MNPSRDAELFRAGSLLAVELGSEDLDRLQTFFEKNPEYFLAVTGQPPSASEAEEEFQALPPGDWPYTKKWMVGFVDETATLVGMAVVISDLLASGVWHIGLFVIATNLHGSGAARSLYQHLENWVRHAGGGWLRLGVVEGNARAERFWERAGFVELRKRRDRVMGTRTNTVRVMVKPLGTAPLEEYFSLVERDRRESDSSFFQAS
ncbi:MAG: GNAT family N-acetyltransferase [Burkholderiaceae bacterium]